MSVGYVAAWILPLALGAGAWAAAAGLPRRGATWMATLGAGFVLGNLLVGLLVGVAHPLAVAQLLPRVGGLVAVLALACWIVVWRRREVHVHDAIHIGFHAGPWRWLVFALFVLLGVRAWLLLDEILLRPVFPWDAWWVWAARAKAWAAGGHIEPVVAPAAWWAQGDIVLRTGAWNYPKLMSWLELWYAAGAGGWNESLVNLPWFGLWLALLSMCYGQWRALGVPRVHASVGVYALGSLPLLDVHIALAGYVDLWLATAFGAAVLAWLRWLKQGERGQLALAVLLLGLLPLIKFEGMVWALCLAAPMTYAAMPSRWRHWGIAIAAVGGGAVVGLSYALDLAWIRLVRDLLSGASGGRTASSSFAVLRAFGDGLFVQYNWHLFWYLVFGVMAWRWRRLWRSVPLRLAGGVFALAMVFVLSLFLLTPAAKWAESYTAVNRLMLGLVPLAATLCVLLLRDLRLNFSRGEVGTVSDAVPVDTVPATTASSAPE